MYSKIARGNKTSRLRREYKSERFVWFLLGGLGTGEVRKPLNAKRKRRHRPGRPCVCEWTRGDPEALTSLASRASVRAGDIARVRIPHTTHFCQWIDRRSKEDFLCFSLCESSLSLSLFLFYPWLLEYQSFELVCHAGGTNLL